MLVIEASMSLSVSFGLPEQRRGSHDLPRLAIAALWNIDRRPGPLHGMRAIRRQAFDGGDPVAGFDGADGNRTGALHFAIDMHGHGALRDAATATVPVRPSCSRITQSSGVSLSTCTSWVLPLTLVLP